MPNPTRDTIAGQVYNDLRNLARRSGRNTEELLTAYLLERFLYRISSTFPQYFILKGGLLLARFAARRPTRDIDVLARSITNDPGAVQTSIAAIAAITVDDGVVFDIDAIRASTIREDASYWGVRATLPARIANARLKLSLDINFGDPVTPAPQAIELPQLLHPGTFTMLGYPIETVLAEKLTTAIALGDANTRDRDYADIYRLIIHNDLMGSTMTNAVQQTAAYRRTSLRRLSEAISTLATRRQNSYAAWRRRQGSDAAAYPEHFADILALVTTFSDPLLCGETTTQRWDSGNKSWTPVS